VIYVDELRAQLFRDTDRIDVIYWKSPLTKDRSGADVTVYFRENTNEWFASMAPYNEVWGPFTTIKEMLGSLPEVAAAGG
jgi:hypothetical protein